MHDAFLSGKGAGLLWQRTHQHLLSLINDILDLSKVEAGRMELTPAPFHLPTAVENAVTLVKERAARHGIALHLDLDPRVGELVGRSARHD